ncbi:MAG: hypothetical protein GXX86_11240 [Propionibacterium sp.]|nr:hypothetical protein [Propionibacterium sp.]
MDAPAPRRAIDAPSSTLPRRAIEPEPRRPLPVRRLLVSAAVALGMIGGGVAVPLVDARSADHVETVAAPRPQGLPTTPPEAAPSPQPAIPTETPAPKPSPAAKPTAPPTPPRERTSRKAERPAPVVGIVSPCEVDAAFPENASPAEVTAAMEQRWGLKLIGEGWNNPQYRPVVKIIWQTLDAVDCTPYLESIRAKVNGDITINAGHLRGYAWGDWGLSKPGVMSLDFGKMHTGYQNGETTRIARVFIHELAHVHNVDRGASPQYWQTFNGLYRANGSVAEYDRGRDITETYAEAVAHFVVRCSTDNPYSTPGNAHYFDFVQEHVFGGREFGPTSGQAPACG